MADDLLVARGLVVAYGRPAAMFARRSVAPAVLYGIDIHVGKGETVGIVGESGSGKTTLGRALLGLVKPVAGSVIFDGRDITALDEKARRPLRRRMQMIFQDPMSSLNPRHTIGRILTEPVLLHGLAQDHAAALALVQGVLDRVGLQRGDDTTDHALTLVPVKMLYEKPRPDVAGANLKSGNAARDRRRTGSRDTEPPGS